MSTESQISRELRFFISDVIESRNKTGQLGSSKKRIDRNLYLISFFKGDRKNQRSPLSASKFIQAHIEDLFELTPKDNITLLAKLSFLKSTSANILHTK